MKRLLVCAAVLCAVGLAGCASEKKIGGSQPGPPDWVIMTPADKADAKVFVGIGLGDNILDERGMRDRAMEDVRHQIAASLKSSVVKNALDIVKKKGAEHLNEDVPDASYYKQVRTTVDQAMAGVRQTASYWEKWKIDPGFWSSSYTKYKQYVKAEMPSKDYDLLRNKLVQIIAADLQ